MTTTAHRAIELSEERVSSRVRTFLIRDVPKLECECERLKRENQELRERLGVGDE